MLEVSTKRSRPPRPYPSPERPRRHARTTADVFRKGDRTGIEAKCTSPKSRSIRPHRNGEWRDVHHGCGQNAANPPHGTLWLAPFKPLDLSQTWQCRMARLSRQAAIASLTAQGGDDCAQRRQRKSYRAGTGHSQRANPSIRTFFFALNRRTRCLTRLFNKFWIFVLTAPLASMLTALWPNSREMPQESYGNFP